MADFDLISSTTRGGIAVDQVEFAVDDASSATGYLLGRDNDGPQPIVVALHDERGDKATLLPDLEYLAARGFLCLSIDSPVTRRACAARDPLAAFTNQLEIGGAALRLLQADAGSHPERVALIGRGIGGEVAATLAAEATKVRVVVAVAPLPDRSAFVAASAHPLAAGLRQFHDGDMVGETVAGLRPHRLVDQLHAAVGTHWLLQVADDDNRYSDEDHATLSLAIPRTVRVDRVAHSHALSSRQARRTRVDFISNLCG